MREVYKHNKTGRILFVLFDIFQTKGDIKHYQTLDEQYRPNTTTIDNLDVNYTLAKELDDDIAKKLHYIKISK